MRMHLQGSVLASQRLFCFCVDKNIRRVKLELLADLTWPGNEGNRSMIYCIVIQDIAGEVIGSATFDISDSIRCTGYKLPGHTYPAPRDLWGLLDDIVAAVGCDLDKLSPK